MWSNSLFALKSDVGTGTVVGSELFNMLAISGASVLVVGRDLKLDPFDVSRELFFYLVSILLLFTVMYDGMITKLDAAMLVGTHVVYVCCCIYWKPVREALKRLVQGSAYEGETVDMAPAGAKGSAAAAGSKAKAGGGLTAEGNTDTIASPLLGGLDDDDEDDDGGEGVVAAGPSLARAEEGGGGDPQEDEEDEEDGDEENERFLAESSVASPAAGIMESRMMLQAVRAAQFRVGQDWVLSGEFLGFEYGEVLMHGWLKKRIRKGIWVRRWFSIHPFGICQCRDPMAFAGKKQVKIRARGLNVDDVEVSAEDGFCFRLRGPRKTYVLKAPTTYLRDKWMESIRDWLREVARHQEEGGGVDAFNEGLDDGSEAIAIGDGDHEHEHDLFARPKTPLQWVVRVVTLPVLLPIYVSMPVPHKNPEMYMVTILLATAWLAVCSFLMASAADTAGCLMNISSAVIGLTVGAAGTSLPNMFASMLVARQGYADMAISNAFGSNIFNIFIALGLPWFLQVWFVEPSKTFRLESADILSGIRLLVISFFAYVAVLFATGWKLTVPVGWVCLMGYGVYIVTALAFA